MDEVSTAWEHRLESYLVDHPEEAKLREAALEKLTPYERTMIIHIEEESKQVYTGFMDGGMLGKIGFWVPVPE